MTGGMLDGAHKNTTNRSKKSPRRLMTHTEVSYANTSRWKTLTSANTLVFTPNTVTTHAVGYLNLGRDGALVMELPQAASGCGLSFQGSIGTRQGRRSFPNASPRQRVLRHGARLPFVVDCRRDAFRGERFMHSLQVLAPGLFNLDIAAIDARAPPGMVISPDLRLVCRIETLGVTVRARWVLSRSTFRLRSADHLALDVRLWHLADIAMNVA